MAIDWNLPDFQLLKTKLMQGSVVLFAGAGFSFDTKNGNGQRPPLGDELADLLAKMGGFARQGESLPIVFDTVGPQIGENNLWKCLAELYRIAEFDDWYRIVSSITWHRIYTLNIDNLFEKFAPYPSGQRLEKIVRGDPPHERDQLFEKLQCVHLHGHVDHRANGLTFTLSDFAEHTARPDPWYQSVVDDLCNQNILFVGTQLEEPQLHHYIQLRGHREKSGKENRPKSFLVCPGIGAIRQRALLNQNILAISCSGQEFFESLRDEMNLPDLRAANVRSRVWPHLIRDGQPLPSDVAVHFDVIVPGNLPPVKTRGRTRFFLGAEPTWHDIATQADAVREINTQLRDEILAVKDGFHCVMFHGPSGSGTTTTIMRVALDIADQGHHVYFARGFERTDFSGILALASKQAESNARVFVFVDIVSRQLDSIAANMKDIEATPNLTLVCADRTSRYASKCQRLSALDPRVIKMPRLCENDVNAILDRLDTFDFLGKLKDKSTEYQIAEFMDRADRHLLVALREATRGEDFNLILQGEFEELDHAAKLAYTICSIAVSRGSPGVFKKHLSPCIPKSNYAKGVIMADLLRGVLVDANFTGTMLKPRHGVIAKLVAEEIAPVHLRYEAIATFLRQISPEIVPNEIRRRSAPFLAYRGMINSNGLRDMLEGDTDAILSLYDEVRPCFNGDFLFWLQYGMAHILAGNYDIAENFLNQSLNIRPSHQTTHHLGVLHLIRAYHSKNPVIAEADAKEGIDTLRAQIYDRGDEDEYPHHAYLTHVLRWYQHAGSLISREEWEDLRKVANEARSKYRLEEKIREAADNVDKAYLVSIID